MLGGDSVQTRSFSMAYICALYNYYDCLGVLVLGNDPLQTHSYNNADMHFI